MGIECYDPRKVVPDIIAVLAKHKVRIFLWDRICEDVRAELTTQVIADAKSAREEGTP